MGALKKVSSKRQKRRAPLFGREQQSGRVSDRSKSLVITTLIVIQFFE